MKASAATVAAFLAEYLPGGWEANSYTDEGARGVHLSLYLTERQLAAMRRDPGAFLDEITPNKAFVAEALAQRPRMRFIGPYASRAILRRKAGL